jgi:hypothetical protein
MGLPYAVTRVLSTQEWLDVDKFDIIAKPPTTTAKKLELQAMLQALLSGWAIAGAVAPHLLHEGTPTRVQPRFWPAAPEGDCGWLPGF